MATHSSILAWQISGTEEPGGLQSTGSQESQTWLSNQTATITNFEEEPVSGDRRASIPGNEDSKDEGPRGRPAPAGKCGGWGSAGCWRGDGAQQTAESWPSAGSPQLHGDLHPSGLSSSSRPRHLGLPGTTFFFFFTCMLVLWSYPNLSHYILGSTLQTQFNDNPQSQHFNLPHGKTSLSYFFFNYEFRYRACNKIYIFEFWIFRIETHWSRILWTE